MVIILVNLIQIICFIGQIEDFVDAVTPQQLKACRLESTKEESLTESLMSRPSFSLKHDNKTSTLNSSDVLKAKLLLSNFDNIAGIDDDSEERLFVDKSNRTENVSVSILSSVNDIHFFKLN